MRTTLIQIADELDGYAKRLKDLAATVEDPSLDPVVAKVSTLAANARLVASELEVLENNPALDQDARRLLRQIAVERMLRIGGAR